MNEVVMKTLTRPLLALAKAEEKGDAPVTNAQLRALDLGARIICAELCKKKKKASPSPTFSAALSHHLPATSDTGWNYAGIRGNAIISIS